MRKCEGHINWWTCEKMMDYRLKQEFQFLAKVYIPTGRNENQYALSSTNRFKTYILFVPITQGCACVSRISYKNLRPH